MLFANLQICCGGCLQNTLSVCIFVSYLFMGLSKVCRRKPSKTAITFIVCLSLKNNDQLKKSQSWSLVLLCCKLLFYLNKFMSPESLYFICWPAFLCVSGNLSVP